MADKLLKLKTAELARKEANIQQAMNNNPVYQKAAGIMDDLSVWMENHPESMSLGLVTPMNVPIEIAQQLANIWGFVLTYTNIPPPPTSSGNQYPYNTTWVAVTNVSWADMMIGERDYKILQADVINNSGTLNTLMDTGLQFSVKAGQSYYFKAFIPYTAGVVGTGSRWVLDGPAAQLSFRSSYPLTKTTFTNNCDNIYNSPALCNATSPLVGNAIIEGEITPSANGILKIRFASEIAASPITAKAGAILEWTRVL